ncbi:MAG: hypothetical protein AB7T38_02545 [Nitrospirales bacterium]
MCDARRALIKLSLAVARFLARPPVKSMPERLPKEPAAGIIQKTGEESLLKLGLKFGGD